MVVRQRRHAGTEADVLRALRHRGDEQLRAACDFPATGMMLADPGFIEAELVEPDNAIHILFEGECGMLFRRRVGSDKRAEAQAGFGHIDVSHSGAVGARDRR